MAASSTAEAAASPWKRTKLFLAFRLSFSLSTLGVIVVLFLPYGIPLRVFLLPLNTNSFIKNQKGRQL
jgi:hypothetical protein